MIARRQPLGAGAWLILSLLCFIAGFFSIHQGLRYAGAAPTESTTIVHLQDNPEVGCRYVFSVDGVTYRGGGNCEIEGEVSILGKLMGSAVVSRSSQAIVYYDRSNPSTNSLIEFGANSRTYYRDAALSIGIAFLINLPYLFLAVYAAMKNKGNRGVFVDAQGTVIYPDQVDFTSAFGELPGESGRAAEPSAAARDKAARDEQFAASHGLRELYLDVVKQIHPDHASNEADRALRERLTKEANAAFDRGDDATLRRVLEEYTRQAPQL
jgi:hypothetical protein